MRLRLLSMACATALTGGAGPACADIPSLLHAHQFAEAEAQAATYADPVAPKLVTYERLLTPGAASPAEIDAFLQQNPDWPNRALLKQLRDQAIAQEPDDAQARTDCAAFQPTLPAALARCADALKPQDPKQAEADARRAWADGLDSPDFYAKWKSALRPEDELARFKALAAHNSQLAAAQIAHLAPADRPAARTLLALRHHAAGAFTQYQALPKPVQNRPDMLLAALSWLRRDDNNAQAVSLWRSAGEDAEKAAPAARRPAFWAERNALARQLLTTGDNADAEWLADDQLQTAVEPEAASAFLAGFIALRRLNDPAGAEADFRRLAGLGKAAITQGRAWYWIGQAEAAAGKDPKPDYQKAAAYPLTFYGQLALHALGKDDTAIIASIRSLADPPAPTDLAWRFAGNELVRAAAILSAWGQFGHARAFLFQAQQRTDDPAAQALSARLGLALGLPETAVVIARRMGVEGQALPTAGWPEPYAPPPSPPSPALVLAVVRQESSFDAGVVSPAGARGLMQLMPATAESEAARAGDPITPATLTRDPTRNMALGASYLRRMLARFGGSLPLAIAAYNAGPHRVDQWLQQNSDPRKGGISMVDWIELIPFDETRNYVERVLENAVVYQARLKKPDALPTSQWMQ